MSTWYERAEDQIERDLADGLIDGRDYQSQMNDLRAEMREVDQEQAEQAYSDAMGGW